MSPTETVTLLFTDLVGSTELSSRLGSADAEVLRQTHFAVLREAIEATGGTEVKNLGDGLMVAYASVGDALECGVGMQQGIERYNRNAAEALGVRIGLSLGDANREEGDYFGTPVIEAARLCAKAQGGQILTTELVRMMAGRGGHELVSVGELELKGLPEPVPAYEVAWEPLSADATAVPLPARLQALPATGYVGRGEEREQLEQAWERARGGERQVVMISGEAGIGKTRLSTHLALEARASGATILFGSCDEDVGLPYQPFVEALRHYVDSGPEEVVDACLARHGGELSTLLPELPRQRPETLAPTSSDPETERYLLFGAVVGLLAAAADDAPLVLILDDLHWVDKPTLSLLKHLVAADPAMPLLVLGTYRESDISQSHPLTEVLADLRRVEGVERIALGGLEQTDVVALMEAAAGHDMDPTGLALAQEVRRETAGNPFFVAEILRHLAESGAIYQGDDGRWAMSGTLGDLGLPQSVREVVGRRVQRLGEDAVRMLSTAAVIGQEFDLELLTDVSDASEDRLLDLLDEAVAAEVLLEPGDRPGWFRFAHALIGHTLYEELGATRRARTHRRIGEALERVCGDDPGPRLGELAHHWATATTSVEATKAIEYARRAGDRALDQLAPDEAMRWFASALELHTGQPDADRSERCELLIRLGEAQQQAGDADFRQTLLDAAALAEELEDGRRLVRAALANTRGFFSAAGIVDDERVAVLEAAVPAVPEGELRTRARVLALLAQELSYAGDLPRRRALCEEALDLGRRSGEDDTLAHVTQLSHNSISFPDTVQVRLAAQKEGLAAADRLGDPVRRVLGAGVLALSSIEAADVQEADRCFELTNRVAEEVRQPTLLWFDLFARSLRAFLAGRIDESEDLSSKAVEVGTESGEPDALAIYVGQLICVRYEQGRLDEVEELIAQTAEDNPGLPAFQALLALSHCELGREDDARQELESNASEHFDDVPHDLLWLTTMTTWADVAAHLRLAGPAADLYERLRPWEEQIVCNGATTWGAVARPLGILATTLGRYEEAEAHFALATEIHERIGAALFLARTQLGLAEMLLERGADDDTTRARAILDQAVADARELGAASLERRALSLVEGVPAGGGSGAQ